MNKQTDKQAVKQESKQKLGDNKQTQQTKAARSWEHQPTSKQTKENKQQNKQTNKQANEQNTLNNTNEQANKHLGPISTQRLCETMLDKCLNCLCLFVCLSVYLSACLFVMCLFVCLCLFVCSKL